MTGRRPRMRIAVARAVATVAVAGGVGLACFGYAMAGAGPSAAVCGRGGGIPDILLGLQKPATTSLWRDKTLFVLRDGDDGTLWAFSVRSTTVHPAVRCRRGTGESGLVCSAGEKACASFTRQADDRFDALAHSPDGSAPRPGAAGAGQGSGHGSGQGAGADKGAGAAPGSK